MAVPADKPYDDLVLAALGDGKPHSVLDLGREAAERFQRVPDGSHDPMASGNRTRHRYHTYLAVVRLFQEGLVERSPEGLFRITSHGRAVLAGENGQDGSDNHGGNRKRRSIRFPPIRTVVINVLIVVSTALIAVFNALKRRSIRVLLIWTAISTTLGLLFFWLGSDTTPTRPVFPDGGILVFVSGPHDSADINFIVDTQGDFAVRANGNNASGFLVIASGSAAVEPVQTTAHGTGSPPDFTRGVRLNSIGSAVWKGGEFRENYHEYYEINGYAGDGDVTAAAGFEDPTNMNLNEDPFVYGKLRSPIFSSSSSGSVEVGQLPLIGALTTFTRVNIRFHRKEPLNGVPITIAGQVPNSASITKWYVPTAAQVHIAVVSSPAAVSDPDPLTTLQPLLPPGYKLDSAGPATVNSDELLWQESRNVQATWDLTNLSAARQISVWLFISGILFGIAASFLGVLTDRLLKERDPNKESGQAAS